MTDPLSDPSADAQRIGEITALSVTLCDYSYKAGMLGSLSNDNSNRSALLKFAFGKAFKAVEWLLQRVAQAEEERDAERAKVGELLQSVSARTSERDEARRLMEWLDVQRAKHIDRADAAESALAAARQEVERHRRLCLAELGGPDVWPCGCHERILDSHGTRQLLTAADGELHQECEAHLALRADLAAARLLGREERTEAQGEKPDLVAAITAVVRDADRDFEHVGGSSRHWVRECFLPTLNAAGLLVTRQSATDVLCRHCNEELRYLDGAWCDRETHSTCLHSEQRHEPTPQAERETLIAARDEAVKERDREKHRTDVVIAEFDAPWPHTHTVAERLSNSLVWKIHECRAGTEDRALKADAEVARLSLQLQEAKKETERRAIEMQAVGDEFERVGIPADGQIDGSILVWQVQQLRFGRDRLSSQLAGMREALEQPTASGRKLTDLLTTASTVLEGYGGGPLADDLWLTAQRFADIHNAALHAAQGSPTKDEGAQ